MEGHSVVLVVVVPAAGAPRAAVVDLDAAEAHALARAVAAGGEGAQQGGVDQQRVAAGPPAHFSQPQLPAAARGWTRHPVPHARSSRGVLDVVTASSVRVSHHVVLEVDPVGGPDRVHRSPDVIPCHRQGAVLDPIQDSAAHL